MTGKYKVLIIDDDESILNLITDHFSEHDLQIESHSCPVKALKSIRDNAIDLVISDVKMNELSGDDVLNFVLENKPGTGVFLMTGYGNINHGINAMKKGASDYITKPFCPDDLLSRVKEFLSRPETNNPDQTEHDTTVALTNGTRAKSNSTQKKGSPNLFIGEHPKIKRLHSILDRLANNDAPVFIRGESGTGKEVFANLIHFTSRRREKPYVKINCANLPSELVESTLFGHIKGSFTGAITDSKGAFETAEGGTLLLDEVTEININVQAKLLRVLQEREYTKVGSQQSVKSDVRIIATSNRNLTKAVNEGIFRQDLYYRLNVFPVSLPPLRDRREDILVLAEHFVTKFCDQYCINSKLLSADMKSYLTSIEWKGNVRELENLVHRGVIMAYNDDIINVDHVLDNIFEDYDDVCTEVVLADMPLLPIEEMELQMIRRALEKTNGNQKEAAQLLEISDRTIRNKLRKINFS
ncbi:MAG: sigma-54-dependent Fis family transcriptional regulator [Balneolaceae bacterium]|nr:MAG: sigma-54-dependent Fis family transcriptional regulator [Balneolaceae bacterium]